MSCHVFLVKRNPQKHMLSLLHMLANSNSIWPASCFCTADTIRVNFIVLNGWKFFLKNISWHVKIIWNPDFCVYKHTFIGTKPRPFFNCRLQAAFATREELSSCDIKTIQIAKPKSCYLVLHREIYHVPAPKNSQMLFWNYQKHMQYIYGDGKGKGPGTGDTKHVKMFVNVKKLHSCQPCSVWTLLFVILSPCTF